MVYWREHCMTRSRVMCKKVSETLSIGVLTLDSCEVENFLSIVVSGREVQFAARAIHTT